MKEKIVKIIKENWFNSFPEIDPSEGEMSTRGANRAADEIVKLLSIPDIGNSGSICECRKEWLTHINDTNSFPHGEHIEFDKCTKCGKIHNMNVH